MTLRNYGFKFRFQRYSSSVLSWPSDNCFKYLKTRTQGNRALNIDLFQPHNKALKRILFSNLQRNFLLIRCLSISSCTSSKHNNKSCSSLNLFRQTNYRNKATKMSFCTGIVDTTSCPPPTSLRRLLCTQYTSYSTILQICHHKNVFINV